MFPKSLSYETWYNALISPKGIVSRDHHLTFVKEQNGLLHPLEDVLKISKPLKWYSKLLPVAKIFRTLKQCRIQDKIEIKKYVWSYVHCLKDYLIVYCVISTMRWLQKTVIPTNLQKELLRNSWKEDLWDMDNILQKWLSKRVNLESDRNWINQLYSKVYEAYS